MKGKQIPHIQGAVKLWEFIYAKPTMNELFNRSTSVEEDGTPYTTAEYFRDENDNDDVLWIVMHMMDNNGSDETYDQWEEPTEEDEKLYNTVRTIRETMECSIVFNGYDPEAYRVACLEYLKGVADRG